MADVLKVFASWLPDARTGLTSCSRLWCQHQQRHPASSIHRSGESRVCSQNMCCMRRREPDSFNHGLTATVLQVTAPLMQSSHAFCHLPHRSGSHGKVKRQKKGAVTRSFTPGRMVPPYLPQFCSLQGWHVDLPSFSCACWCAGPLLKRSQLYLQRPGCNNSMRGAVRPAHRLPCMPLSLHTGCSCGPAAEDIA